jgi:vacuolar-type H+-ATPase subunit F/Vma7
MEGKIAVLGSTDFVMPFSALGVDTYPVGLSAGDIDESVARQAREVFSAYEDSPTPCIMVVPFTTEPEGFATQALGEVLKTATGINILENN